MYPVKLASRFCTHDDAYYLAESISSVWRRAICSSSSAGSPGTTSQFDGAGNLTTQIDANSKVVTNVFQSNANRLQATVDSNGLRTSFSYDSAGQQTEIRDARGNRFSFTFDNAGRMQTQRDPLNNVLTTLWDAAGRNTTQIDANGNIKTITFDAAGRLVTIQYADATRVTLQYDALGRRTTMADSGGTTTYAYSDRSEPIRKSLPGGHVLNTDYDEVGNRKLLVNPDGGRHTFTFDALNRSETARDPDNNYTTFQYDSASRRTTAIARGRGDPWVMDLRTHSVTSCTFAARLRFAEEEDDGTYDQLLQGRTLWVAAMRPGCLRIEDVTSDDETDPDQPLACSPYSAFVSDGVKQYELVMEANAYVMSESAADFRHAHGESALPEYVGIDTIFDEAVGLGFHRVAVELADQQEVEIYSRVRLVEDVEEEQRISVRVSDRLPVRLSVLCIDSKGRKAEVQRTEYTDWVLDPALPPSVFEPTPPSGSVEMPPDPVHYEVGLRPGMSAADIQGVDLSGVIVSSDQYAGRVLLVEYWATWCQPCRRELVDVRSSYEAWHDQGLEVVGVALDESDRRSDVLEFISAHRLPWPQIHDGRGFESPLAKAYQVHAIPFSVLVGRDASIAAVDAHGAELRTAVWKALRA